MRKNLLFILISLPVLLFSFSCQYREGIFATVLPTGDKTVEAVAVLPFHGPPPSEPGAKMTSCPICGAVFQQDKVLQEDVKVVEGIFLTHLVNTGRYRIITPEETQGLVRGFEIYSKDRLHELLGRITSSTKADAVIIGHVFRYRERVGLTYAVRKPASVALEVHLIRVRDGTMIWKGVLDRTQSSLMENILLITSFYQRGGRWLTVREFVEEGIAELMKTLP